MAKANGKYQESHFYCTQCGKEGIPIQRKKGQERKSGHLKKLYCLYCQEETNHVEIKDYGDYTYEDFQKEFILGRFKDGNRTELKSCLKCSLLDCPFNQNGICWNANNSNNCKYKPRKEDLE